MADGIFATLHAHPDCAAAVLSFKDDNYRIWETPDDPGRFAVTYGGSKVLHDKFIGDWTFAANLQHQAPTAKPCAWCVRNHRYAH